MMSAATQAPASEAAGPPAVESNTRSMRVPQLLMRAPLAVLQHVYASFLPHQPVASVRQLFALTLTSSHACRGKQHQLRRARKPTFR